VVKTYRFALTFINKRPNLSPQSDILIVKLQNEDKQKKEANLL